MEPRWVWPFELIEKLGEGGMGVVYRARYSGNDRMVAVKLLPPEVASDPVLLARFERELDVLKQLRHPNIVRCFGGTCESAERFYAMELVEGGTLADLLSRKGRLSWEFVVDFALQMCEALQYAHEHGVIHRDVKPENFLLTKSGQIKLSDFGLAAIATTNRLTAAGRTVGTIQYMAPEQIRGKPPLTGRADLYALGCVLFEMLTGHPPYSGENAANVMQMHLTGPIPHVSASVMECPLKLDQLICEMMNKDPEARPTSAAEVGWRLEEILQPGRRAKSVDPDLFFESASTTRPVSPLQDVTPTPSSAGVMIPDQSAASWIPWATAGVLLLVCTILWVQRSAAVTQLRQVERQWVELVKHSDPGVRDQAVTALSGFDSLQVSTLQSLREASQNTDSTIRVAALSALQQHAAECRWMLNELMRMEKVDEHPEVRHHAGLVVEAMKQAPNRFTLSQLAFWTLTLAAISGLAVGGRHVWMRMQRFAA